LDFSSKILNETERPKGVGEINQSDKNYTLHTSPEEKNAYRGTYNINREIKTVFSIRPLFSVVMHVQTLSPSDENVHYGHSV
jgi:hypothetical protein